MIGPYQVVERLGGGAMAELYLAHKRSPYGFVRRAVVKRVKRSRPDSAQLQEMLLDEARATACFDHPNLVSLFDVGETEEGVYLALEYVEGSDLRRVNAKLRARKEALPFELAVFVTVEVLRGLHHAHTSKDQDGRLLEIIHRDVNPSNVLIARSGHVKLADFGVVRMRERVQQQTEPGLVKGKYAYLAPEYIAGEPCSIQTDVYAAGIMLFELLSGRECFSGKTAYEVMWKIVNKGVPMYRLEREGVPEDLQRIVQRATAMAPERRYQSAQDMANALEAWLMRSGRHATPWVLSVFFQRHELLPARRDSGKLVSPLASAPSASEGGDRSLARTMPTAPLGPGSPRVVEPARTPLPSRSMDDLGEPAFGPGHASSDLGLSAAGPPSPTDSLDEVLPSEDLSYGGHEVSFAEASLASSAGASGRYGHPKSDLGAPTPPRFPPGAEGLGAASDNDVETVPFLGQAEVARSMVGSAPRAVGEPPKGPPPPPERAPEPLDPSDPPREGNLADVSAVDLLECLVDGAFTGTAAFEWNTIWKKVKLFEGQPVAVISNMGMELIGEHLVASKVITSRQRHQALKRSEAEHRALTAILLEDGSLDRDTLERELGRNLAGRLEEVLGWQRGRFVVDDEEVRPPDVLPRIDLQRLFSEAREARRAAQSGPAAELSDDLDPKEGVAQAVDLARSLATSAGRGRIERPWRPEEG